MTFNKQNARVSVPDSNAQVIAGHSDVRVEIHVVDSSQVRPDTYILTFVDTAENSPKRLTVHNQTTNTTLLNSVPFFSRTESPVFEGFSLYAEDFVTSIDGSRTGWTQPVPYVVSISRLDLWLSPDQYICGYRMPDDYKVIFYDTPVDTSVAIDSLFLSSIPIPFRVLNLRTQQQVRVGALWDSGLREIIFLEDVQGNGRFTWDVAFSIAVPDSVPHAGDTLLIYTRKGLSVYDSLRVSDIVLEVGELSTSPTGFHLFQNYPNPFNPTTSIKFKVPGSKGVTLKVYDVLGREVATLVDEVRAPGTYTVQWDASGVSTGVYFYRLQAGAFAATRKLLLLR